MPKGTAVQRVAKAKRPILGQPETGRDKIGVSTRHLKAEKKTLITPRHVRELRQRLSPDPEKPLSQQRLSQLLNVSWSTVARWESGGTLDTRHALKLVRLQQMLDALGDLVLPEYRLPFFEQQHPLLLDLRPIDLLDTEEGAKAVIGHLQAATTGAFA